MPGPLSSTLASRASPEPCSVDSGVDYTHIFGCYLGLDRFEIQSVTSKLGRGGRRYAPYALTEQGVAMLR